MIILFFQKNNRIFYPILWGFVFFWLGACTKSAIQPVPIYFSKESCHHCKMTILDKRFGGELMNEHGKTFKFDSLECLLKARSTLDPQQTMKVFAVDSFNDGKLLPAEELKYMLHKHLKSPMGQGILASPDEKALPLQDAKSHSKGAAFFSWDELQMELKKEINSP